MTVKIKKFAIPAALAAALFLLLAGMVFSGPAAEIADKVAPRDATGDLEKIQGGENASGEEGESAQEAEEKKGVISGIQLLTLPKGNVVAEKESEEPPTPVNIMKSPQVERLLNPQPDFIYNPGDLKDPMIVPWVRNSLLIREFLENMERLAYEERKFEAAKSVIRQIEEIYPEVTDVDLQREARDRIAKAREFIVRNTREDGVEVTPTPTPTPEIIPPAWIINNFRGVIWEPRAADRMALIGDEIVQEGQPLVRYPEVTVVKINPSSIVIEYRGITKEYFVKTE